MKRNLHLGGKIRVRVVAHLVACAVLRAAGFRDVLSDLANGFLDVFHRVDLNLRRVAHGEHPSGTHSADIGSCAVVDGVCVQHAALAYFNAACQRVAFAFECSQPCVLQASSHQLLSALKTRDG